MNNSGQQNKDEISLKELILKLGDWLSYFFSKWKIILIGLALGAILGYIYASTQKPVYTAELTFALEDKQAPSLGAAFGIARVSWDSISDLRAKGCLQGITFWS